MDKFFAALLKDKDAIGTALVTGLIDEFGTEWFTWEPDSLILNVQEEWKVELPVVNRDKIWALVTVLTTNNFYNNVQAFEHICNALSGSEADFENRDPANVSEIAWGITEATIVDPPVEKDSSYEFSLDIVEYITKSLESEGFTKAPKILAKLVTLPEIDEAKLSLVTDNEIDFKAHWDDQSKKRLEVESWVAQRLTQLGKQLGGLQLKHADRQAIQNFRKQIQTALAGQQRQISSESSGLPRVRKL